MDEVTASLAQFEKHAMDEIKEDEAKDSEEEKKSAQDAMDAGSSTNSQF
jgi:hypothetical protein